MRKSTKEGISLFSLCLVAMNSQELPPHGWIFRCGQIFFQSSCNSALMRMSQITNANDYDQSAVSVFQHEREFVSLRLWRSLLFISSLLNAFAMLWLFCLAEIYLVDSVIRRLNKRGQEFVVYDNCIRVKEWRNKIVVTLSWELRLIKSFTFKFMSPLYSFMFLVSLALIRSLKSLCVLVVKL